MRWAIALILFATATTAPAVEIVLDYTYDTANFFGSGNPSGAAAGAKARASVEAAADYFTEILTDNLARIEEPADYISTAPGGSPVTYSWEMQAVFNHPTTGASFSIEDPVFEEDEYRIFVGSRDLPGLTIGQGGPGALGYQVGGSYYFQWQLDEINAISADFYAMAENRSQAPGDFGTWGGALTFDPATTWNYDHTVSPSGGQNDLYSVAIHEIGHALGFGTSDEWFALVSGGLYLGAASYAANDGSYPTVTGGHWTNNLRSPVYGAGGADVETVMDPELVTGKRALWTELDAAGLADIGWEVTPPDLGLPGDYNADNVVDAADYTVWRDSVGTGSVIGSYAEWRDNYGATAATASGAAVPEPAALTLLLVAFGLASRGRR